MTSDMEYTELGDTGLEVSRICLGCMNVSLIDDELERLEAPIEPTWSSESR